MSELDPVPANVLLPLCADKRKVAWNEVGEAGAVLTVPGSTLSLTISEGSFEHGRVENLWICEAPALKRKLRPSLNGNDIIISPIVIAGPLHILSQLKKPVVFNISHIGGGGLSSIRVLQCDRPSSGSGQWECVAVSGQDNATSSTSVYIDHLQCILVPEKIGAYVIVANTDSQERTGVNSPAGLGSQERCVSQERTGINTATGLGSQERCVVATTDGPSLMPSSSQERIGIKTSEGASTQERTGSVLDIRNEEPMNGKNKDVFNSK